LSVCDGIRERIADVPKLTETGREDYHWRRRDSKRSKASEFVVENTVPILRQKISWRARCGFSGARVYFVIQLMYTTGTIRSTPHATDLGLVSLPHRVPNLLDKISEQIVSGDFYNALKLTKKLIDYEEELLSHVKKSL
jgi:flagellar protein FlbT